MQNPTYERLLALESAGVRYGLDRIRAMLADLGHPELQRRQTVLIAGTNGKGSVAATLSSICANAGVKVGLFTSPHLAHITERFRLDDQQISWPQFDRLGARVLDAITQSGIPLSFFEAMVTLALLSFQEHGAEVHILEAGLGGRRDATRRCTPTHAVITGVGLDHTKTLGPTLAHIAAEKLDICEPGASAMIALPPRLQHMAPPGWLLYRDVTFRKTGAGLTVKTPDQTLHLPTPSLHGPHQRRNAAIAAAVATQMGFTQADITRGMNNVHWPGRMQKLATAPDTWLDGAHNPAAIDRLLKTLSELSIKPGFTLVFGAHPFKNTGPMLRRLAERAGAVILTTAPRLSTPTDLAAHLPNRAGVTLEPECGRALQKARALGRPVLIAGSLYLAGAVLRFLEENPIAPLQS